MVQTEEERQHYESLVGRGAGDPDIHGYPGQKYEPSATDWAMSEINNALITLEKHGAVGYVSELKAYRVRLQKVIDLAVKPF